LTATRRPDPPETTRRSFAARSRVLGQALAEVPGASAVLVLGVYIVIAALWQIYQWGDERYKSLIANSLVLPINVWALVMATRVSRSRALSVETRRGWSIMALAFLANLVGQVAYLVIESVLQWPPFPSIADLGFLAFYPLMLWGVLSFPRITRSNEERLRFWSDSAVILVGAGMGLWYFVVRPLAFANGVDPLERSLATAYIVGDTILVLCVATIWLRRTDSTTQGALYLVTLGLLAICINDVAFAYVEVLDRYTGVYWADGFWNVGMFLLAVAAHYQLWGAQRASEPPTSEDPPGSPLSWLPYLMVTTGYVLLVWSARSAQGDQIWVHVLGVVVFTAMVIARQMASVRETSQHLAQVTERRGEARLSSLLKNLADLIAVCDASGKLVYWSPSFGRALGWDEGEIKDRSFFAAVHPHDEGLVRSYLQDVLHNATVAPHVEFRLIRRGETWSNVEVTASNLIDDENVRGIVLNMRDVSERKVLESQLIHQAFHDTLTGLANRALFRDRVQHALARNTRTLNSPAVFFFDIDDFRTLNDTLGHAEGDQLLLSISQRLQSVLRAGDTAARIGGDEFAVLVEDVRDPDEVASIAERLIHVIREPFQVRERDVTIQASVGIAIQSSPREGADDLMRNADVALYSVKAAGKNSYATFSPEMHQHLVNRLSVRSDLEGAVERGEFRLHYQPIVALDSDELMGLEALVRWQHPERGMVPPAEFIPLAEETGQIVEIGKWVLIEASRQLREWHELHPDDGRPPLYVSVNLSSRQLDYPKLVDYVSEALQRSQLDPSCLMLEITESMLMQNTELNIRKLRQLSQLGLALAVDDFGTGYSSLSYLRRFPVKILKVDKSFVDGIEDDADAETLVRAIISLGHALNLQIVAEGIEHAGQLERLRQMGCDRAQGFLYGHPLRAEELTARLTTLPPNLARRMSFGRAA
jgi:diguanylate cyclase (GGDEF)-like protein/PAS domain S-box-containing protein